MSKPSHKSLLEAINRDDFHAFTTALEQNGWPSDVEYSDYDLLVNAAKLKRKLFVNYLLNIGCRVHVKPGILTPLHFAVLHEGWLDVIVRLVSLKCPIDAKYIHGNGNTAVHIAYDKGQSGEVIDLLLWTYLTANNGPCENVANDEGFSFLHIACSRPNANTVGKLLAACPGDIDLPEKRSLLTPLHIAVHFQRFPVARYLLKCKADIYKQNCDKSTPLHLALKLRHAEMINLLLHYDERKENVVDKHGLSHFMAACAGPRRQIVEEYLRIAESLGIAPSKLINAKVRKLDCCKHYTPLHFAVEFGQIENVKLLLDRKADCCALAARDHTPHTLAREKGHDLTFALLNEHCKALRKSRNAVASISNFENVPPNGNGTHAGLPAQPPASREPRRILPAFSTLLMVTQTAPIFVPVAAQTQPAAPAEPPAQKQLLKALEENNTDEFVSVLRSKGCPTASQFKHLTTAIKLDRKRMVMAMLDANFQVQRQQDSLKTTPLHLAATKVGWTDVVERLLDMGCRADDENCKGDTPLDLAFIAGNVDSTVDVLLKSYLAAAASESAKRKLQQNGFLHIACTRPSLEVVRRFVELKNYKPDSLYSETKATPLHFAVKHKRHEIAEYLIRRTHGASIYAVNSNGSTPLHLALELRDVRMIDLLLAFDTVRTNIEDRFGVTHFMAACAGSNPKIVQEYLYVSGAPHCMILAQVKSYGQLQISGYTPLHFASQFSRVETVDLLLGHGADCCLVAADGSTCHSLANKPGMQLDVYANLKEHCEVARTCRQARAQSPDFGKWGEQYEWSVVMERTRTIKSLRRDLSNYRSMNLYSHGVIHIDD